MKDKIIARNCKGERFFGEADDDPKRSGLIEEPRDSSRGSIKRGSVDTTDKRRRGDEIERREAKRIQIRQLTLASELYKLHVSISIYIYLKRRDFLL